MLVVYATTLCAVLLAAALVASRLPRRLLWRSRRSALPTLPPLLRKAGATAQPAPRAACAGMASSWRWTRQEPSKDETAKQVEKLRGYHDLAKDVVVRAAAKHQSGSSGEALKLYQMGLSVCDEALSNPVPTPGIGNSNVGTWRRHLLEWREAISRYIRQYEAGLPMSSISPPQVQPPPARTRSMTEAVRSVANRPAGASQPRNAPAAASRKQPPGALPIANANAAKAPDRPRSGSKDDEKLRDMILSEVLDERPSISWDGIAGLHKAKQALQELVILPALRSDLFQGIRAPARGLLLYGPPGNGKTMLAKALAHEAKATFFSLSASSLTSRWMGEGEKLVRTLFAIARERAPSVIFLDEIDSILSARSAGEHEASRRLKTEFLVQFDGMAGQEAHVVVIGATNRPQELDDAVRRRLEKRIYIPLPDTRGRAALLGHVLKDGNARTALRTEDVQEIAHATHGYSGADLTALCREAAMQPLREIGQRMLASIRAEDVRPVTIGDFAHAMVVVKPSTDKSQIAEFDSWTRKFGTAG